MSSREPWRRAGLTAVEIPGFRAGGHPAAAGAVSRTGSSLMSQNASVDWLWQSVVMIAVFVGGTLAVAGALCTLVYALVLVAERLPARRGG
jgi:hypothetical protein